LITPERAYPLLRFNVSLVVSKQKKWIVIEQILDNRAEQLRLAAELPASDVINYR